MEAAFRFLEANPYILLFLVVGTGSQHRAGDLQGLRPGHGGVGDRLRRSGCDHRPRLYGVTLQLDAFTKSFFYYLFMYGVGLRVGPSFLNSLKGDGARFAFLAVFCSVHRTRGRGGAGRGCSNCRPARPAASSPAR